MRRELYAVQRMAQRAGVDIRQGLGGRINTGALSEMVVLVRELMRGNFSRLPGSLTLLAQRMGLLKFVIRDTATAARLLADAWQDQSIKAGLAAIAATRKAAASAQAFAADTAETEATLSQAVADETAAAAAITHVKAMQAKAVAAGESAAAETGEASATIGTLGIIGGVIVGIGAGAYASSKLVANLVDKLAGLKAPDFHPEYVAKHLQAVNQAAEAQRDINKEVQRTIDLYNSAAKAAERTATATKEHFEHLVRMNQLERDPAKRDAGELAIRQAQRAAEFNDKANEQAALTNESARLKQQADAVKVTSKEQDENLLRLRKAEADDARKYLKDLQDAPHGTRDAIMAAYNKAALSGVSSGDLADAAQRNFLEANRRILAEHSTVDQVAANDQTRKSRDELDKQAGQAAARAAELNLQLAEDKQRIQQVNQDDQAEAAAAAQRGEKASHGQLTANQQIGAYAPMPVLVDVAKAQLHKLTGIDKTLKGMAGKDGRPIEKHF